MKFSINVNELNNVLSIVGKGVALRSSLPALAGILIKAEENEITLRSSDLDLYIQATAPALIEEDGEALLPAKLLADIVKTLPDEAVSVSTTDTSAKIECGKSSFDIRLIISADFPDFPNVTPEQSVELPFAKFSDMTKRVARMVSHDDNRAIFKGINVNVKENTLEMVATDAYRIVVAKTQLESSVAKPFSAVIPGEFMVNVANATKEIDKATVSLSKNQVVISAKELVFVSSRIEGNFPAYNQLIPESPVIQAKINTKQMDEVIKRIGVLSSDQPTVKMHFDVNSGVVALSGKAEDVGSVEESIECEYINQAADPIDISFNINYTADGLNAITTKNFIIEVTEPVKPAVFKDDEGDNLTYVLFPVRS